ncbi:MAG: hypothetical protein JWO11_3558 [Nocardioides sp.]|nr:hypothetical protein [Nocardioides sp.]
MSAPERNIAVISTIHTSELAIRDDDPHWTEIHRVLGWTRLSDGISCSLACGGSVKSQELPVALSSGEITGPLCEHCFGFLIRSSA